jgi:thiosulfate/3-mercaptopyruvate sulfurtransferase
MRTRLVVALLGLLTSGVVRASSPRDGLVVNAAWLAAHLHDPDLVLLHVGEKEGYAAAHIPGARFAQQSDVALSDHGKDGLMLEMPPAEDLRHRLKALGISDQSRVVVYYGKDWVSPSTRIIFTLDYAGLGKRASLLDGGMDAWIRNGGAVTKEVPPARNGSLAPLKIRPLVVDAKFVRDHIAVPHYAIVDGRDAVYFDGVDTGEHMGEKQRTGHIASAHSIPYTSITDDSFNLKSPGELQALFTKAGVKAGDTVIGYCHIGQQTTAMLFAARTLGYPVLLYDGSMQDWSRHTEYPMENPAK